MAIELEVAPAVTPLPDGLTLESFRTEDALAFYETLDAAFQDHWEHHSIGFERWWEEKRGASDFDPTLWFLVRDGDDVAAVIRNDPERNGGGYVGAIGVARAWRGKGLGRVLLQRTFAEFFSRGVSRVTLGVDAENPTGATQLYESVGMTRRERGGRLREGARVSVLRAKCPNCRTLTAVAIGPEYECHSCGRTFAAGLVRVPRAWGGRGGEAMVDRRRLPLDYPEARSIEEDSLHEQTLALASDLPVRPLILGGCCCSHVGAVEGLAARHERLGIVWFDAHGDLNTPETSPSGNEWGMPLRMIIDGGAVDPQDVALVGARNLDPPEVEFIAAAGIHDDVQAVLDRVDCVYVAIDVDVFEPSELAVFMPEPGGPTLAEVERQLARIREGGTVVGAGLTGLAPERESISKLERLTTALGL